MENRKNRWIHLFHSLLCPYVETARLPILPRILSLSSLVAFLHCSLCNEAELLSLSLLRTKVNTKVFHWLRRSFYARFFSHFLYKIGYKAEFCFDFGTSTVEMSWEKRPNFVVRIYRIFVSNSKWCNDNQATRLNRVDLSNY
jgi:hypothetical protein